MKNGKKTISPNRKETTLFELVVFKNEFLPFTNLSGKGDDVWTVDRRKGIGYQAKKPTAVCITRARFEQWEFDCEIEYDERKIKGETVRQLFDVTGSSQGVAGFRPNCGGPFGRFHVEKWEEVAA